MKYRIIYYIESRDFGGAERRLFILLSGLDKSKWEPILVYHPYPNILPFIERVKGLDIATLSLPSFDKLGYMYSMRNLIKNMKALHPAVFHAHLVSNLKCTFGIVCAYLAGIKAIVVTQHSYQKLRARRLHKLLKLRVYQKLISTLVDCYIAGSYGLAKQLRRDIISHHKIQIIYNGLKVEDFTSSAESNAVRALSENYNIPVILTVARLDKMKGHKYLLEAASQVSEALFIIAGDGTERVNFENQVKDRNLADRVIFLGERNDIPDLLKASDLFVLPTVLEGGLPFSILEAMSASKPVISTDIDGVNELIINGENGLLVPPGDSKALAQKIELLLSDKSLANKLAVAGKETVIRNFTSEKMIKRVTDIYCEIIKRKGILHN